MTRAEACKRIDELGVIAIVRVPSPELAIRAALALLAGGISIFEITMTVPDAIGVIRFLTDRYGARALVGAGTVLTAEDAGACVDAGAQFVVSPGVDRSTIAAAHALDVPIMPGALTPTEVIDAWRAGADWVKIFPCSALGGAKYLRALRGPLPQVKMCPTGGVSAATAYDYLAAGAAVLGIGSELVDPVALAAGEEAALSQRARALVDAVRVARASLGAAGAP
jgi:2-dehydro-3-deoxyphosphogluconate aldolase/(4S)-4-hydroxy-2-oxoglutarate aldolase